MTLRTFIAIPVPIDEKILGLLGNLRRELFDENIKWVEIENLHIAIRFFSKLPEEKIPEVAYAIQNAAQRMKPFEINLFRAGLSVRKNSPSIIWLGINDSRELKLLYHNMTKELRKVLPDEEAPKFFPHLTLGRVKKSSDINRIENWVRKQEPANSYLNVNEVVFYQSILNEEGPTYHDLSRIAIEE